MIQKNIKIHKAMPFILLFSYVSNANINKHLIRYSDTMLNKKTMDFE